MSKTEKILAAVGFAIIAVGLAVLILRTGNSDGIAGAFGSPQSNLFSSSTLYTTTTHASLPVMVLPRNTNRLYASIVNDSATAVYIHLNNFDDPLAASTTVEASTGIRLNASGGSYEILTENNHTGEVWASSTAPALTIMGTDVGSASGA